MKVVIIGAGVSGLSAAFMLRRRGVDVEVLESASYIGGFAHSFAWSGHTCDWSAHRLFTHDDHVLQQLLSLVPMNRIERRSAVYLGGKWLKDPVDALQLCRRFFPGKTFSIPFSYAFRPRRLPETSFQSYCYARFGRTLARFLFCPYTVRMFGIPADRISVEWARKKVRLAGPLDVIRQGSKKKFSYFYYPQAGGFGSIPQRLHRDVKDAVKLEAEVVALETAGGRVSSVRYRHQGAEHAASADWVISTIPMTTLCSMLGYEAPLSYRAVSAVYVLVNKPRTSPNHWVYYMDERVTPNRLCEVKNMDPGMGPPGTAVLCAEVTDHDRPDFVDRTVKDLAASGLFSMDQVLDTTVVTRDFSYPVYRCDYEQDVDRAREFLARFANLRYVGRAAEFEHMEVDDCFASATQLTRELTEEKPMVLSAAHRAPLPVEPQVFAVVAGASEPASALECLRALAASDYGSKRIVLVFDPQRGAFEADVKREFPAAICLPGPSGMGIPAAFNVGCSYAARNGADFVFCTLARSRVQKDLLSQLVRVAQRDPEAGVLTPKILSLEHEGRILSIGSEFRSFPPSIRNIGAGKAADRRHTESREVEFAVSAGLLIKRDVLEKVGLFDPGYVFFYEDIDFSERVRREGFRIRFVPEAQLYSTEDREERRSAAFYLTWGESFARFYRRHMQPAWLRLPLHLAYLLAREMLTGGARHVPALLRGIARGCQKPLAPPPHLADADW